MTPADLAAASLRASPLLAAVLVACVMQRRASPSLRHTALMLGLMSLALMPWIAGLPVNWTLPAAEPLVLRNSFGSFVADEPAGRFVVAGPAWLAAAALIWALGTAALLLRVAIGLAGLARLRRRALRAGASWPVRPGRPASRVAVCVSPEIDRPLTIGFLRPLVLLPPSARGWSRAQRRAVLAHEFAHVRRGDAWWLLSACLVRALHWPNPLVWLIARRTRAAAEEACDEAAVLAGREFGRASRHGHRRSNGRELDALDYAQFLVRLARSTARGRSGWDALIPAMTGRTGLAARLERLLSGSPPARPPRRGQRMRRAGAFATIVLAAAFLGTGSAVDPPAGRLAAEPRADRPASTSGSDQRIEEDIEIDVDIAVMSVDPAEPTAP